MLDKCVYRKANNKHLKQFGLRYKFCCIKYRIKRVNDDFKVKIIQTSTFSFSIIDLMVKYVEWTMKI